MRKLGSAVCVAFALMAPVTALAHHAAAMFETEKTVTVSGIVEEFPSRGECLGHGVKIEAGRGAGHEGRFAVHRMARKCAP